MAWRGYSTRSAPTFSEDNPTITPMNPHTTDRNSRDFDPDQPARHPMSEDAMERADYLRDEMIDREEE